MNIVGTNQDVREQAPIIGLVDSIITKAIVCKASDIHFESTDKNLRVRYRIDGMLYDQCTIEQTLMPQTLSRIKVLANINIAEKRVPQDGKFKVLHGADYIDLRVSTFPSIYGEKIVVRILDRTHNKIALEALGMDQEMLNQFNMLLHRSNGFFFSDRPHRFR